MTERFRAALLLAASLVAQVDPRRGRENGSDVVGVFDIGTLAAGHTADELAAHVRKARSSADVADRRPRYFESSLPGVVTGGLHRGQTPEEAEQSLLTVLPGDRATWSYPGWRYDQHSPMYWDGRFPTFATVCYAGSREEGGLVPVGVVALGEVG